MTGPSSDLLALNRRRLLTGAAVSTIALFTGFGQAHAATPKQTTQGAPTDFGPVKQIVAGDLDIGYVEMGPASGPAVLLLHGWPYDIHAFAEVAPLLAAQGYRVVTPHLRGYGSTLFRSAETHRNGQQSAFALDAIALMDALGIKQAVVAGFDWGARTADILAVLWPERCKALVSVSGYLVGTQAGNAKPLPPSEELLWWYQFYFATERGKEGYAANTNAFNRLIWQLASPKWQFDDATFARSAASFANPDHVAIVIDNYRWRLGITKGEGKFNAYEAKLAAASGVTIPSITMEGDSNGAPHPSRAQYRGRFKGPYQHRDVPGGVGHNLPQEAPQAFAQAVLDAGKLA